MGPGGSGLPGALGAWALARMRDANRKIAGKIRWNKQDPFLSSQFSILSSQFSVLSSQNWMCFLVLWIRIFWSSLRSAMFIGELDKEIAD
jgi:hypothetical protein